MFKKANLSTVFETDNKANLSFTLIFDKFKMSLVKGFMDNLSKSIENMSRLCYCREFQAVLNYKQKLYILAGKNRKYRLVIAKFRSSAFNKIRV